MTFSRATTIDQIYRHPIGRDAIDQIVIQAGISPRWVLNPLVRRLRLGTLEKLARSRVKPSFVDGMLALLNGITDAPSDGPGPTEHPWWRSAVFYQIYPRSFQDSNGDGIGDLRGIISRLDYLRELGVDCLWLSPIFASPNEDMGYDISDYRAVMPEMGTLADVDELIAACHHRGMRIILDLVVNHTSDQHLWFQEAVANPDGERGNYYIFREGTPDKTPNNWDSYFSGPAWRWVAEADRWVLRLFAPGQPDLNWEHPPVRREVADIVQWWLARGIDGFRLDVINYISKQPGLPDGDPLIGGLTHYTGIERYCHGPRLHEYLRELRRDGFTRPGDASLWPGGPGADPVGVMIGETPAVGVQGSRLLSGWDRQELDLTFLFTHLMTPGHTRWDDARYDLNFLKRYYADYHAATTGNDWLAVFWENHDNPRMVPKVEPRLEYRTAVGKLLATILLTMRGTPFIFQGQELATWNQDFQHLEDFRDIETINRYLEFRNLGKDPMAAVKVGSRDHARVPIKWTPQAPHYGFTTGEPWLGFHESTTGHSVEEQLADDDSVLNWYKRLIALRRAHPALTVGDIEFLALSTKHYFAWYRTLGEETWLIEMNLSATPLKRPALDDSLGLGGRCVVELGTAPRRESVMQPYEVVVCKVMR